MSPFPDLPPGVNVAALSRALAAAHEQVAVALWLSGGMLCASAMIVLLAASLRRCALACGLAYAATLCFVPVGHARVLGPCGAAAALVGLAWPGRRCPRR
ncbi:MAG: hypothetical protein ACREFX_09185 [Opitutaceae bacterium]